MRKLRIKWTDLEEVWGSNADQLDFGNYLDTESGEVIFYDRSELESLDYLEDLETLEAALEAIAKDTDLSQAEREQYQMAVQIEWGDSDRYLEIPASDSREGYRDMEDFIEILEDPHLQEVLSTAIEGKGAFRRFKDALLRYPEVRQQWFTFERQAVERRIGRWLSAYEIEPEFV